MAGEGGVGKVKGRISKGVRMMNENILEKWNFLFLLPNSIFDVSFDVLHCLISPLFKYGELKIVPIHWHLGNLIKTYLGNPRMPHLCAVGLKFEVPRFEKGTHFKHPHSSINTSLCRGSAADARRGLNMLMYEPFIQTLAADV